MENIIMMGESDLSLEVWKSKLSILKDKLTITEINNTNEIADLQNIKVVFIDLSFHSVDIFEKVHNFILNHPNTQVIALTHYENELMNSFLIKLGIDKIISYSDSEGKIKDMMNFNFRLN